MSVRPDKGTLQPHGKDWYQTAEAEYHSRKCRAYNDRVILPAHLLLDTVQEWTGPSAIVAAMGGLLVYLVKQSRSDQAAAFSAAEKRAAEESERYEKLAADFRAILVEHSREFQGVVGQNTEAINNHTAAISILAKSLDTLKCPVWAEQQSANREQLKKLGGGTT